MEAYPANSSEHTMNRLIPVTVGALQMSLAAIATYVVCSGPALDQLALFTR